MKILFMCVAYSARSQLAEAVAKQVFGNKAEIFSGGSRPTKLNPFAVRVIGEIGPNDEIRKRLEIFSKEVG